MYRALLCLRSKQTDRSQSKNDLDTDSRLNKLLLRCISDSKGSPSKNDLEHRQYVEYQTKRYIGMYNDDQKQTNKCQSKNDFEHTQETEN